MTGLQYTEVRRRTQDARLFLNADYADDTDFKESKIKNLKLLYALRYILIQRDTDEFRRKTHDTRRISATD